METPPVVGFAPEIDAQEWLNTERPLTLAECRGRVVVIEGFQMLCPGCVQHSLPQAQRLAKLFRSEEVLVIGVHTVFEHHEIQGTSVALAAFLHENRIEFPVAIDKQTGGRLPSTMVRYAMRGTPTTVLIDSEGQRRFQHFGGLDDLSLGVEIGRLLKR
jgi:thiol-disulfide isomerase/thioredoxin